MCSRHNLILLGLKSKVGATTVDIVDKTTTLAEKQITTASCLMLISHCAHQPLVKTVLNCIHLRACHHQNIVKRKDKIYSEV